MLAAYSHCFALPFKRADFVDLETPLRRLFSNVEADSSQVQLLRRALVHPEDGHPSADALRRYYRCLNALDAALKKHGMGMELNYSWFDALKPETRLPQSDPKPFPVVEQAAVLYNLAAHASQQAAACNHADGGGLKQACLYFQEAAGLLAYLGEQTLDVRMESLRSKPCDVSTEVVVMLEKLMMAQAQECVFLKAVFEKKVPSLLARLASQTHDMFAEAGALLSSPVVADYMEKPLWERPGMMIAEAMSSAPTKPRDVIQVHIQFKTSLYKVQTLVMAAQGYGSNDEINNEICVLREASQLVKSTLKVARLMPQSIQASVSQISDSIRDNLNKAEKDNSTVYLLPVPNFADIPSVQGVLLVKLAPPQGLHDASEVPFTGLQPKRIRTPVTQTPPPPQAQAQASSSVSLHPQYAAAVSATSSDGSGQQKGKLSLSHVWQSMVDDVERRTETFVKSNPRFQEVAQEVFTAVDLRSAGHLTVEQAAQSVDIFFDKLQAHLDKIALTVKRPTMNEVLELYRLCDTNYDRVLDLSEFQNFYAKVVVLSAVRATGESAKSYGIGIVGGYLGAQLMKRAIRSTPIIGFVLAPVLALVPPITIGPFLGVGFVYMFRKGKMDKMKRRLLGDENIAPQTSKA